jgi:signal peptidase I
MTDDGATPGPATPAAPAAPDEAVPTEGEATRTGVETTGEPRPGARHGSRSGTARRSTSRRLARKPKPKRSFLRELPGIIITALVISVLIKTFLVQAFYIPSGSMENTLLVNDRVLVNKLADKPDEIHRGDVVVFKDPGGWLAGPGEQAPSQGGIRGAIRKALVFVGLAPATGEEDLIKRVIGVGGDHVAGRGGHVFVNGVRLQEPYVYPGDKSTDEPFNVVVPKDELWVMGDHRSVSEDSRAHQGQPGGGFVPVDDVIGRAFTIVWPPSRAGILHPSGTIGSQDLSRAGN